MRRSRSALRWLIHGVGAAFGCLLLVGLASALWGGFFGWHASSTIFGGNAPPGLEAAKTSAMIYTIVLGVPLSGVSFVVGCLVVAWRAHAGGSGATEMR